MKGAVSSRIFSVRKEEEDKGGCRLVINLSKRSGFRSFRKFTSSRAGTAHASTLALLLTQCPILGWTFDLQEPCLKVDLHPLLRLVSKALPHPHLVLPSWMGKESFGYNRQKPNTVDLEFNRGHQE